MPWVHHASPAVNAQSEYGAIIAVSMSLTVLMVIIVLTRAYVRYIMVKLPGTDDYVTFFSAVVSIVYNVLVVWQTRMGLGLPVLLRPKADLAKYSVVNFASRPLYMLVVTAYKVALCLAYLRFIDRAMNGFRKIILGVMVFIIISHLVSTLVIILQCHPVEKSWRPTTPGWCLANYPTWNGTAAVTIVCDIDRRRKIGLISLFVLGLFTTVCSIMRMLQIKTIAKDGNNSGLVLWATAEMNLGIALSSVPALTPLLRRFFHATEKVTSPYTTRVYTPGSYGDKSRAGVRLQSLSRPSKVDHMDHDVRGPKEAHVDDQGSEEDILPSPSVDVEPHSQWITKTVDVYVSRAEGCEPEPHHRQRFE